MFWPSAWKYILQQQPTSTVPSLYIQKKTTKNPNVNITALLGVNLFIYVLKGILSKISHYEIIVWQIYHQAYL